MFGQYAAHIQHELLRDEFRLDLVDRGPASTDVLCVGQPVWRSIGPGEIFPEDHGIVLPGPARKVILRAVLDWAGDLNAEATEVKVLREWLTVERQRVDRVWNEQ